MSSQHHRDTPLIRLLTRLGWQRDSARWAVPCHNADGHRAQLLLRLVPTGVTITPTVPGPLHLTTLQPRACEAQRVRRSISAACSLTPNTPSRRGSTGLPRHPMATCRSTARPFISARCAPAAQHHRAHDGPAAGGRRAATRRHCGRVHRVLLRSTSRTDRAGRLLRMGGLASITSPSGAGTRSPRRGCRSWAGWTCSRPRSSYGPTKVPRNTPCEHCSFSCTHGTRTPPPGSTPHPAPCGYPGMSSAR